MSTHPTILGEMVKQQALGEDEKTSLDVERDLGLPADADLADAALFVDQAQAFAIATHPQHPVHPGQ